MATYIGLVFKDEPAHFSVTFPDLPGCRTEGRIEDELMNQAREALERYAEELWSRGDELPIPTSLSQVQLQPTSKQAEYFVLIEAPQPRAKFVTIQVILPEPDLQLIDEVVERQALSRSEFLLKAARALLKGRRRGSDRSSS